jgi:hypothetical protein
MTLIIYMTSVVCLTLVVYLDSDRTSRLWSHFPTTPVVSRDFGRASWLWPMSVPHVLLPQL